MSRQRRWVAGLRCLGSAALTLALAAPAAGQAVTAETLHARLDSLMPLYRQAQADLSRAEQRIADAREAEPRAPVDSVRVGPFTVVAYPDEIEVARSVFSDGWAAFADLVGESPELDRAVFAFARTHEAADIRLDAYGKRLEAAPWRSRASLEDAARSLIGSALAGDLSRTRFARWVSSPVRDPRRPDRIYRELAVTPSKANRACLGGDARACWTALGLGIHGDPLEAWWTPAERRMQTVAYGARRFIGPDQIVEYEGCRDRGDGAACDALLRSYGPAAMYPLDTEARASLLWLALERGGDGAWDRLVAAADGDTGAALEAASGLSADELAAVWLSWVRAARPEAYAGLGATGWITMLWFLVFGALALSSTRWRVGR